VNPEAFFHSLNEHTGAGIVPVNGKHEEGTLSLSRQKRRAAGLNRHAAMLTDLPLAGIVLKRTQQGERMIQEESTTRICLKMKQVIMETPVEYNGQITTRLPMKKKQCFYLRAKKEGIKPAELQRRIINREMNKWQEEELEEERRKKERK